MVTRDEKFDKTDQDCGQCLYHNDRKISMCRKCAYYWEHRSEVYKAGWREHLGTGIAHYFAEGEYRSLCNYDRRDANDEVHKDATRKCSRCVETK